MKKRRVAIAVRQWNSEEGTRTWKFCKQHVLQVCAQLAGGYGQWRGKLRPPWWNCARAR